ncbi:MAG TPA: tryptophan synthase subunit alpha [Candidatus Paceibacterota bacterium]|nr:tryptophan synthase subunit alpha [Candidatus Paceibacterota bacterium]
MTTPLEELLAKVRGENRAALIAYLPAGFPSAQKCKDAISALARAGVDAIEIGFPYSDPVMDGPTIQEAADISLRGGTGAAEVLSTLKFAHDAGLPAVVMTYWNPIERYGVDAFAKAIASNGGSGVITPDLTIEESETWQAATSAAGVNTIYVLAPSSTQERIAAVTGKCSGFVYAASLMGVTGARTTMSSGAQDLVSRIRSTTDLPVAVGLGVSTREQARYVAGFADGVIVGSAFIKALLEAKSHEDGLVAIGELAKELAMGVREGR